MTINSIIIGAQKAGTSSLLSAFSSHPEIAVHSQRELAFFVNDDLYAEGWDAIRPRYYGASDKSIKLAKSVGVMYRKTALERLYMHNPNVTVIVSLRHPVDRAVSAFNFFRKIGMEPDADFQKALETSIELGSAGNDYIGRGDYVKQLQNVYDIFNRDRVHIVLSDDLVENELLVYKSLEPILLGDGFGETNWQPEPTSRNKAGVARFQFFADLKRKEFPGRGYIRALMRPEVRDKVRSAFEGLNTRSNSDKFSNNPVSLELRQFIWGHYSESIPQLENLIGRDLTSWRNRY